MADKIFVAHLTGSKCLLIIPGKFKFLEAELVPQSCLLHGLSAAATIGPSTWRNPVLHPNMRPVHRAHGYTSTAIKHLVGLYGRSYWMFPILFVVVVFKT